MARPSIRRCVLKFCKKAAAALALVCLSFSVFARSKGKDKDKGKDAKVEKVEAAAPKDSGAAGDGGEAKGEEEKPQKIRLTVEQAVAHALENNKKLKSAAIDLEIKKRASAYSWNSLIPTLGLSATGARTTENSTYESIKSGVIQGARLGALEAGAPLSPSAYDSVLSGAGYDDEEKLHWAFMANLAAGWNFNLAMVESIRMAKSQYEAGLITWEKTSKETEMQIRKMFYGLLLQQESLQIERDKLDNAQARYRQASANYRSGLVPQLQMLNAQVTYENQRPKVLTAEQELKQQFDLFAFLLGLPYGREIELDGKVDAVFVQVDADELLRKYLDENLDVQNLRKSIEIAKHGLGALKFQTFTPSVALAYNYQPVFYAAGEWNSFADATDNGTLSLTLAFSDLLQMLPFSANFQKIKDTEANIEKAEIGLDQTIQNTEIEIHKAVDTLQKCQSNIESMERTVQLAQTAYSSTLRAYNSGTQELLEVRDAEDSLNQARLGLTNEKFNYISALLDLENKLNIKLVEEKPEEAPAEQGAAQ